MPTQVHIPINGDTVYDGRHRDEVVGVIIINENHPLIMEDNYGNEFVVSIKMAESGLIEHEIEIYLSLADKRWYTYT